MRELGKAIHRRRVSLGISQRTLGTAVGKSHTWVANLEKGLIDEPRSEDLTAIAEYLSVEPTEYLRLAGRVNLAAAKIVPARDQTPEWVVRLEQKLDTLEEKVAAVSDRLEEVDSTSEARTDELTKLLRELRDLFPPAKTRDGHGRQPRPGAARGARRDAPERFQESRSA